MPHLHSHPNLTKDFFPLLKVCTCTKTVNEHLIATFGVAAGRAGTVSSRLKRTAHLTHEGEFFHKERRKSHRNKEASGTNQGALLA